MIGVRSEVWQSSVRKEQAPPDPPFYFATMSTVFIFHGIMGNSKENWFPWLKQKLEEEGHTVFVPDFPNADTPQLADWMVHFEQYKKEITDDTIFIGHSLGATMALRILESITQSIRVCYLVAPVSGIVKEESFNPLMNNFLDGGFDFEAIKAHAKKFIVFQSDDDKYIPFEQSEKLSKNLNIELTSFSGYGHFNAEAGYSTLDVLLENVKAELEVC